ncbi:hypothetical protein OMF39_08210, partial [Bordetella pertussis]
MITSGRPDATISRNSSAEIDGVAQPCSTYSPNALLAVLNPVNNGSPRPAQAGEPPSSRTAPAYPSSC